MNFLIISIVAFLTGIAASMGLGGGMILIIYLTIFTTLPQIQAQGINLIFFLPIATISLIIHTYNKLVQWKKIIPAIICGSIGVYIGCLIACNISSLLLTRLFAIFIILIGVKEIFSKTN